MFFFVFLESRTFRFILQTMNIYLESEFLVEFQLNAPWKRHFFQTKISDFGTYPRNFEQLKLIALVLASGLAALQSVTFKKEAVHWYSHCRQRRSVCGHRIIHMISEDFPVEVPSGFLDCCFWRYLCMFFGVVLSKPSWHTAPFFFCRFFLTGVMSLDSSEKYMHSWEMLFNCER